ncbi:MAG: carbamate kinase [Bacilli bacterium]
MRIVVALGGNALGKTPKEQIDAVKMTAKTILSLIKDNNDVVITHGNGPQVGAINLAMDYSASNNVGTPMMPFAECGAMSEGYIGYHLQQAIINELEVQGIDKRCVTLITQAEVLKDDAAFKTPSKPVGLFYDEKEAKKKEVENGYNFIEDSGRGFRRVVASPKPIKIVELDTIKKLIDDKTIVIACGGGGIPVIKTEKGYEGIDAVIDKDFVSSLLAKEIDADVLLILTTVKEVSINFNKSDEKKLHVTTVDEAKEYILNNEFGVGSMLPKIEASLLFVTNNDKKAIITSLLGATDALNGKSGTIIKYSKEK